MSELRRVAFGRYEIVRAPAAPVRPVERSGVYGGSTSGKAIEKENAIEHEGYRRLVASFGCCHCGIFGYSQAAHPPPTGKGRKEDDREVFALCCTRPGEVGCHVRFDQYKLMPHERAVEQAHKWGRETRAKVISDGNWPKNLPMLEEA